MNDDRDSNIHIHIQSCAAVLVVMATNLTSETAHLKIKAFKSPSGEAQGDVSVIWGDMFKTNTELFAVDVLFWMYP